MCLILLQIYMVTLISCRQLFDNAMDQAEFSIIHFVFFNWNVLPGIVLFILFCIKMQSSLGDTYSMRQPTGNQSMSLNKSNLSVNEMTRSQLLYNNTTIIKDLCTGGHRTRVAAVTLDNMAKRVLAQQGDLPQFCGVNHRFSWYFYSIG